MPSNEFFASRVAHAISDAAFRAFILIEHRCGASGHTPEMSIGRANADFCGVVVDENKLLAHPFQQLAAVGLIRVEESAGGVWFTVDRSLLDMHGEA